MGPEGWDGKSVRDHVETAARNAARAHEEIERLELLVEALSDRIDALTQGRAHGVDQEWVHG